MNFLYPNFLRRIDHYLKINYPHVWRTRVHDFGWFSLILGNVLAVVLGILLVGKGNVISGDAILAAHIGFAIFLGFVVLFWAVQLIRFKLKFSDLKMLLTTWLIYMFCMLSLAVNLATFTFSIAYRTANLYSDEVLKSHHDFLSTVDDIYYSEDNYSEECQNMHYTGEDFYIKKHYARTLTKIVSLHNPYYNDRRKVCETDVNGAVKRIWLVEQAKAFTSRPVRMDDAVSYPFIRETSYHKLFNNYWTIVIVILFFLPALLFLVSAFGVRNVLVSAFTAIILTVSPAFLLNVFHVKNPGNFLLVAYVAIVSLLNIALLAGKNKLRGWNHVAGIMMLMSGTIFFMFFLLNGNWGIPVYTQEVEKNNLLIAISILPFSLIGSFIAAWWVIKQNDKPVLR